MRRAALALLLLVAPAAQALAAAPRPVPRPAIVARPIPFPASRRAETVAYARRHYGLSTWRLRRPRVIVEHLTGSTTFGSAFATFAPDVRDGELHELPGLCAHFVVDRDGTIYQLVPLTVVCRHTVGLNWTAVGIEHVGTSAAGVLGNRRQLAASLRLTLWLVQRLRIEPRDVIGHAESLTSRYRRERVASLRCQTHGDWTRAEMDRYRVRLLAAARAYGLGPGSPLSRVRSRC